MNPFCNTKYTDPDPGLAKLSPREKIVTMIQVAMFRAIRVHFLIDQQYFGPFSVSMLPGCVSNIG